MTNFFEAKDGEKLTEDEVFKRLADHDFKDEIDVSNKYLDYAVALGDAGKECVAKKLAEMAYEEYTHAEVQREILVDLGYTLSTEEASSLEQLKHRVDTLFRE